MDLIAASPVATSVVPDAVAADRNDDLPRLKRMFDEARQSTDRARREAETDRDYYDGKQLTDAERAVLRRRNQPEIVINRVRRGIDGVLGVVEQGKTDPRAYPRSPDDEDASDVATDTLRYIADVNRFQQLKLDCLENGAIEGCYAALFECGPNEDPVITQVRWEEFFYDPRARRHDFGDARYLGIAKWMYADQVVALWPEAGAKLSDFSANGQVLGLGTANDSWEDRPENVTPWLSSKDRRLMVVEMYAQQGGVWTRTVFYAGGVLEAAPSAYHDDKGRTICPIVAGSGYVDRMNNRYGLVRDMRDPQDEINARRSKMLHELNVRQIQQVNFDAPPVAIETVKAEAAKPDGVIPPGWQVVNRSDIVSGQAQLLEEAKAEIERMGPNPAILGRQGADASGRSVQLRQQAGLTELARFLGRFADWEMRCYRVMWGMARQFWTAPKWIRVTDDEGAPNYIMVNRPKGPPMMNPQTGQPQMGQDGKPAEGPPPLQQTDPVTGQPMQNPNGVAGEIARMDVDIIVDSVPDTASLEQEVWAELMQLLGSNPQWQQSMPFSVAVKMSPLPKKREIVQMLDQLQEQAQAQQAQAAQQQAQTQGAQAIADLHRTASETDRNAAIARKTQIEATAEAMRAHIDAAVASATPPPGATGADGTPPGTGADGSPTA